MRIAITGNIGTGKSNLAKKLAERMPDHILVSVDNMVHRSYQDPVLQDTLADNFGTLDRRAISDIVFADKDKRRFLEAVTVRHLDPLIKEILHRPNVIIEYPLLFEIGIGLDKFDYIICTTCPDEVQKERVLSRDSITEEKFEQIKSTQIDSTTKSLMSDITIDTHLDSFESQLDWIIQSLQTLGLKGRCASFFNTDALWEPLREAYSEPHRRFHTLQHLHSVLEVLEPALEGNPYADAAILAAWFHDFVYSVDYRAHAHNEDLSARRMIQLLREKHPDFFTCKCGDYPMASLAALFIRETKTHTVQLDFIKNDSEMMEACNLLLDADMAGLASDFKTFSSNNWGIELEMVSPKFPFETFIQKRKQFFCDLISKGKIFKTAAFAHLEKPARDNIRIYLGL